MTQTTNYDLNIVEGTDVVNPLVQTNPNFETIDTVMKANEVRGVANATEVKSGTNHAITRINANAVFKFVATSDFRTGDTFSVDGTTVTATLVDGTLPKDRAFVVGTSVMCILDGIRLTFVNCESVSTDIDADNVNYDNTESGLSATNVQDAIDEIMGDVETNTYTQDAGKTIMNPLVAEGSTIVATRKGKFVSLVLNITTIDLSTVNLYDTVDIITIPEKYRPIAYTLDGLVGSANSYLYSLFIGTNGVVRLQLLGQANKPTTDSYLIISKTFVANS